jgi:hypothetical protein
MDGLRIANEDEQPAGQQLQVGIYFIKAEQDGRADQVR